MLLAAGTAHSHRGDELRGGGLSLEVISDSGAALLTIPHKEFWKGGTRIIKSYLEARKGERYSLVIRNSSPERLGVVIAVDGRNIISGKKSDLKPTENIYIVNGRETGQYEGWRTDQDTVHRFYFTEPDDSYSARTFQDTSAMGVIAVAVYREKAQMPLIEEKVKRESAPGAPSAESAGQSKSFAPRDESAGTGFGEGQYSPTVRVAFEPVRTPAQKMLVKYEWRETLCRKGIINCGQEGRNRLWDEGEYAPLTRRDRENPTRSKAK